jgi:hypothetical protein
MKTKLLFVCLICAMLITASFNANAQTGFWDKSQRVTSGFVDKNPSFDVKRPINYNLSYISFLVFERWTLLDNSNICVIKFGFDSAFGGVKYITNDANKINRNPQIAYKFNSGTDSISNAMIVWEKLENSRVNIYGCTYYNRVWSAPYPIDTGTGNKSSPHISFLPSTTSNFLYSIVYEKNGDIIFKNYESVLNQVSNQTNLTDSIAEVCRNPKVSAYYNSQPTFVVYERQKANGDYALYYKKAGTNYVFTGDTVALRGNNRNANFSNSYGVFSIVYESNFSGKWGVYEYIYNNPSTSTILQSAIFNYRNLRNFFFPIITNSPNFVSNLTSYIVQRPTATKILSTIQTPSLPMDSITVGDSSSKCVITLGNGLVRTAFSTARLWMVYDKDSAGLSTLEARGKLIVTADVKKIGSEIPDKYSLLQNYPNPFNSTSNFKFEISKLSDVKIVVFDIAGREVQTLVNERLQPGTYEASFDGSMLTSGVYFYRLTTDGFTETKRMVLLK